MYKHSEAFTALFSRIQPSEANLQAARELPAKVREYLRNHETFQTIDPHTRLVGSYRQATSVLLVKDVDIVVFIKGPNPGDPLPSPSQVISDLKDVMKGFATTLGLNEDSVSVSGARRSVHVYFADQDFHLDVVPLFAQDGPEKPALVPCKNLNGWVETHPLGFVKVLNEANEENAHKVKDLIKLLKLYVRLSQKQKNMRPKSYWLSALVLREFADGILDPTKCIAELFHDLVAAIRARYRVTLLTSDSATPNIADPVLGHNTSWNYGRNAFEQFMRRLEEAEDWASEAISNETSKEESVRLWQKIFSKDYFSDEESSSTPKALSLDNLALRSDGVLVQASAGAMAISSIPVPRTKFFGGIPMRSKSDAQATPVVLQGMRTRRCFPGARIHCKGGVLRIRLAIQPTSQSPWYKIEIRQRQGFLPSVRVISHTLARNAPHVYKGGTLCLFRPGSGFFTRKMWLSETIVPWAAAWLYYYEHWQSTGVWEGPEESH